MSRAALRATILGLLLVPGALGITAQAPPTADPLFAVTFTTGPAWQADKAPGAQPGFQAHSGNLARLRQEGRILMGGRFGAYGLMLIRARDSAEVRGLFSPDSASALGVFRLEIQSWRTVYEGTVPAR